MNSHRQYFAAKRALEQITRQRLRGRERVHLHTEDAEWIIQRSFMRLSVLRIANEDIKYGHWIAKNAIKTFVTMYIVNWKKFTVIKCLGAVTLVQDPVDESFSFAEDVRLRAGVRDINKYENVLKADRNELTKLTKLLASAADA